MGLHIFIWQSHINAILNGLQSRKYCKVIMDYLLLFIPTKQAHMTKLENLFKANISQEMSAFLKRIKIYGEYHFY